MNALHHTAPLFRRALVALLLAGGTLLAPAAQAQCYSTDEMASTLNLDGAALMSKMDGAGYVFDENYVEASDTVAFGLVLRYEKNGHILNVYSDTNGAPVGLRSTSTTRACMDNMVKTIAAKPAQYKMRGPYAFEGWKGVSYDAPNGYVLTLMELPKSGATPQQFAMTIWKR